MASQQALFGGEYKDSEYNFSASYLCHIIEDEDGNSLTLVVEVTYRHAEDQEDSFRLDMNANVSNPILFTIATTALQLYAACVGLRTIGSFIEVMNDAYVETRKSSPRGLKRRDLIKLYAKNLVGQGPKLRGKLLASLVQCMNTFIRSGHAGT